MKGRFGRRWDEKVYKLERKLLKLCICWARVLGRFEGIERPCTVLGWIFTDIEGFMMPEKPTERTSLLPVAGPSRRYESNEDPEEPVNILVPTWTTLMQPEPPLGTEDPSLKSTVQIWIPCSQWLPAYNSTWLRGDLIAGLTVGIIVVPQGSTSFPSSIP